jgi:hypothetical protein
VIRVIVERSFDPPTTQADLDRVVARMTPCLDLYGVHWIGSRLATDRRRMVCEYDAPDLASVRALQREAGAGFERIWPAEVVLPERAGS